MACFLRWGLAFVVFSIGCGPSIELEDGSTGSSGATAASTSADDAGADAPVVSCRPPGNVVQARLVTGRGTPTFEVLMDASDDPEPFDCATRLPRCNYNVHRLVPLGSIAPGSYVVANGTLSHEVEACSCCNGEDGGSDETIDTFSFATGHLEIDVFDDTCIMGTFLTSGNQWIPFVAERCDE